LPKSEKVYTLSGDDDPCVTVWGKDWLYSERIPRVEFEKLHNNLEVEKAWKPNRKGKLVIAYRHCFEKLQKIRDLSSQMGPRVTERVWEGSDYRHVLAHSYTRNLVNPLALRT
jgi:hypothetical protein